MSGIFKPIFYYNGNDCKGYEDDLVIYKEVAGREGMIAFPSTKNFSLEVKRDRRQTRLHVLKNMKKVLGFDEEDNEVFLDFAFTPPKIELKLKKINLNKNLHTNEIKNSGFKNIILVQIDGISRSQFYSKLPKTTQHLKQSSKKFFIKEFFKYHYKEEVKNLIEEENTDYLNSALKNNFATAYISNLCQLPVKRANHHHQFIQLACDYNYSPYKKTFFGLNRDPFGMSRKCYFGRDSSKISFDYAMEFLRVYKEEKNLLSLILLMLKKGLQQLWSILIKSYLVFRVFGELSNRK